MRRLDDGRATLPTPILTIAWYVWVIGTVWQSCLLPLHLGQEQSSLGVLNGAHMVLADHVGCVDFQVAGAVAGAPHLCLSRTISRTRG